MYGVFDMFGAIKSIILPKNEMEMSGMVVYEDEAEARRKLNQLAAELEVHTALLKNGSPKHAAIMATAVRIREILSHENIQLSNAEKVDLTKTLNRAKVRAFMAGDQEAYKTFRVLDNVSEDVRRYL